MRSSALRAAKGSIRPLPFRSTRLVASVRFLGSLSILEQRGGELLGASLSSVTAAQKLGGSVTGIIAGSNIKSIAQEAAKIKGMDKVLIIENSAYDKVCLE